jgi:hypothetical protein
MDFRLVVCAYYGMFQNDDYIMMHENTLKLTSRYVSVVWRTERQNEGGIPCFSSAAYTNNDIVKI